MGKFIIITSDLGSQKYSLPIHKFSQLECPLGCPVKVTTPSGTFVCKIYPKRDLKDDVIIENTVQMYKQCHNLILKNPLFGDHCVVPLISTIATSITVTVVTKDFKGAGELQRCKLPVFVKSLLVHRVFSQFSSLDVGQYFPEGNIEKILIIDSQPSDSNAFIVSVKTKVKVKGIVTAKWAAIQEKVESVKLGGVQEIYSKIKELVVYPLHYRNIFAQLCAPRGILLYGPSGCGKSSVVQQLCAENDLFLLPVTCSDLSSSDPGGSEERLRNIFKECLNVSSPTVLFLDGVDSICPKRGGQSHTNRLITCLTGLIDELQSDSQLVIVAATNRLEDVDPSLRRPGRLDREVFLFYVTKDVD